MGTFTTAGFSSLDVAGSASSGSALVTTTDPAVGAGYVRQCVSGITGGSPYDIGMSAFIPNGRPSTGTAYVAYFFYQGAGCTGANNGGMTPPVSALNAWTVTKATNVVAPPSSVSLLLELTVSKTVSGGQFQANFDRAFAGPPGTTPVSLLAFAAE